MHTKSQNSTPGPAHRELFDWSAEDNIPKLDSRQQKLGATGQVAPSCRAAISLPGQNQGIIIF